VVGGEDVVLGYARQLRSMSWINQVKYNTRRIGMRSRRIWCL
jgi:hypothetical protein